MKYCRNCGKELNSDIQYCPNCGASVSEEQSGKNENSYQESNADGSLWESLVEFFKALIEYMKEAGLHIIDAIDKIIQMPPNIPKDSIAVTSVYVEEAEEIQKEVSVLCDVSYANGRVKFLSKYSVPTDADYKVIKAGVVATDSTGYAAIQEVQQELTLDTTATTRLKKYGVNTDLYLANFTQYLKTSRTTTWYARGYVTYQDNSGEQHTVYSDMAQYTIR